MTEKQKKGTTLFRAVPLKTLDFTGVVAAVIGGLLVEAALQKAFKGFSMPGFVACHFIEAYATLALLTVL